MFDLNLSQKPPLLGKTHPFPGNDDPLDLSCALIDLVDLCISHQLLSRVFSVETVATKDLNSVSGGLVGHVSGKALGNGGVQRVPLSHVSLPSRLHVRQHEADSLVVDDGSAEGLPLCAH